MKFILTFASCILIFGCSSIRKEHITQPKIENEISITQWLKSTHLFNNDFIVLTLSPEFYFNFNLSSKINFSPIIYPSKSKTVMFYSGCTSATCMDSLRMFTNNITPGFLFKSYITSDSILRFKNGIKFEKRQFDSLACYFHSLNGEIYPLLQNNNFDYYLILPFAKFFGNKKQVKELKKFIASAYFNTHSRVKVILLNMDKQKWWGKEWNNKIELSTHAM